MVAIRPVVPETSCEEPTVNVGSLTSASLRALCVALAMLLAPAGVAGAQDSAEPTPAPGPAADASLEARALFERGLLAGKQGDHEGALSLFRASMDRTPRSSTALNIAITLTQLGRLREALFALDEHARLARGEGTDPAPSALSLRETVQKGLATLELTLSPVTTQVVCDGAPVEGQGARRTLVLDPGEHALQLSAERHVTAQFRLQLAAGVVERRTVTLEPLALPDVDAPVATALDRPAALPAPVPVPRRESSRPWFRRPWVWVGAGFAAAALAVTVGVLASRDDSPRNLGTWPPDP